MEPTQEQAPSSGELPRPAVDGLPSVEAGAEQLQTSPESNTQPASGSPMPPGSIAADDSSTPIGATPPSATPVQGADDAALIADDADLIEKEWVARAKTVVEQTKADPFVQNKELNKVKADYIKKRYNKDIKVSE